MFNFIFAIRIQIDPWAKNSLAKKTHYQVIWGIELSIQNSLNLFCAFYL